MTMENIESTDKVEYDYKHQAWVVNGKYVRCGHPESMNCKCYGRLHEGEDAKLES